MILTMNKLLKYVVLNTDAFSGAIVPDSNGDLVSIDKIGRPFRTLIIDLQKLSEGL